MFRFLLSPRWLAFAAFALVLAAVAIRLGFWQWHRWEDRGERNDHTRVLIKSPQVDVADRQPDEEWTPVVARGVYLAEDEVTVKFAVRDGKPGAEVVTPLRMDDGTTLLVNRGWLPTENTGQRPSNIPAPPTGEVTVEGWWHPDTEAGDSATTPVDGQIRAISSDAIGRAMAADVREGYLALTDQSPSPPDELTLAAQPDLGSGPHFWYAVQWWFFAGLAIVGYFWFARAEAVDRRKPSAPSTGKRWSGQ